MTCPNCASQLPIDAASVLVCPTCARTLAVEGETARLAVKEDIMGLDPIHLARLRKDRPRAWREDAQARLKAIRGR